MLRFAYRYGSTRLARIRWSGPVRKDWIDRFETRRTAAHPERALIAVDSWHRMSFSERNERFAIVFRSSGYYL